jgi:hypothetical protein
LEFLGFGGGGKREKSSPTFYSMSDPLSSRPALIQHFPQFPPNPYLPATSQHGLRSPFTQLPSTPLGRGTPLPNFVSIGQPFSSSPLTQSRAPSSPLPSQRSVGLSVHHLAAEKDHVKKSKGELKVTVAVWIERTNGYCTVCWAMHRSWVSLEGHNLIRLEYCKQMTQLLMLSLL